MVSEFYRRHSFALMVTCTVLLPLLTIYGEGLRSNNDIETWLPGETEVRRTYDRFCQTFGADETVVIAFQQPIPEAARISALAGRLHHLPDVAACWTRQQVVDMMTANDVPSEQANARLVNLMSSRNGNLETLLVILQRSDSTSRSRAVRQIREQLAYCDLNEAIVAGPPVVASQLDMLGSRESSQALFGLTLAICSGLLYLNVRCWKTSLVLMAGNVFSIQATLSVMRLIGQEMNFIMSSLPVMVMVFTTAASIHFIGQYNIARSKPHAISRAMKAVAWPSLFAAATTVIGLLSLAFSNVGPIPAFGRAAAIGTCVSFIIGIGLTPAILTVVRYRPPTCGYGQQWLERIAMRVVNHPVRVLVPMLAVTALFAAGLWDLESLIDPLEFLPGNDPVLRDTLQVKKNLTSPTSIEVMVDFGGDEASFAERLRRIQHLEEVFSRHPNVCHTLSLADFFPEELSEQSLSPSRLAATSGSAASNSLIADGYRLWRISVRLQDDSPRVLRTTMDELQASSDMTNLTFTGLGSLLEEAQGDIFDGFWSSFMSAFLLITVVMIVALRSPTSGLVAMIPNLTPIMLVFGFLGWAHIRIDIGIMMTASIALGLAVDGTFHFLFSYQSCLRSTRCRYRAVRRALLHTGMPIISSAVISGTGLLALGLSPFRPTMKFGLLMFVLLVAALIGDLILLPALLATGTRRRRTAVTGKMRAILPYRSSRAA